MPLPPSAWDPTRKPSMARSPSACCIRRTSKRTAEPASMASPSPPSHVPSLDTEAVHPPPLPPPPCPAGSVSVALKTPYASTLRCVAATLETVPTSVIPLRGAKTCAVAVDRT